MTDLNPPPLAGPIAAAPDAAASAQARAPAAVLDAQALANLAQLDPNGANHLVQRVLSTYRLSLARLLAQVTRARQPLDPAALRLAAHTLKSSSASVGALALSVLCGAVEQAVRDGRLEALPRLLDQLEAEAAHVDAAVHQLLSVQ